jgi:hypothetical protein
MPGGLKEEANEDDDAKQRHGNLPPALFKIHR